MTSKLNGEELNELELFGVSYCWHNLKLLASFLNCKVSTNLGAIQDELKQQSETLKGLSGKVLEDIMIKQPCDAELHKVAWSNIWVWLLNDTRRQGQTSVNDAPSYRNSYFHTYKRRKGAIWCLQFSSGVIEASS